MEKQVENNTEENVPETKKVNISVPAAIITGAVIIALSLILISGTKEKGATETQEPKKVTSVPSDVAVVREDDYVRGNAETAEVFIIEYVDTDCYYCQQFHPTIKTVVEESNGKVAWVFRHFPLSMHPNAYSESIALQCVGEIGGQKAFWSYLDTIMDVTLSPGATSNKSLAAFAAAEGIDAKLFTSCVANEDTTKPIDASIQEAVKIGATGTPFAILVNKEGEQVVIPGAYPLDAMRETIKSLME